MLCTVYSCCDLHTRIQRAVFIFVLREATLKVSFNHKQDTTISSLKIKIKHYYSTLAMNSEGKCVDLYQTTSGMITSSRRPVHRDRLFLH